MKIKMLATAAGPEYVFSEGLTYDEVETVIGSRLVRAGAAELVEGDLEDVESLDVMIETATASNPSTETATVGKGKRGKGKD